MESSKILVQMLGIGVATLLRRPTSVTRVAYDCGFADLSGFSAKYLTKYGESPSQTLRISRQHFW